MSSIQIEVKNCNNLDSAVISLAQQKLNIKFAPNGTGKSTIAKAVLLGAKGDQTGSRFQLILNRRYLTFKVL